MKEYALSLGIPEMNILAEEKSKDTLGNAFFTKITYLEKYNWKNVIVITSDFHLNRTKFLFDNVLGPQYAIKYISVPSSLGADERKKN